MDPVIAAKKLGFPMPEGSAGFVVAFLPDGTNHAVTFNDRNGASKAAAALRTMLGGDHPHRGHGGY